MATSNGSSSCCGRRRRSVRFAQTEVIAFVEIAEGESASDEERLDDAKAHRGKHKVCSPTSSDGSLAEDVVDLEVLRETLDRADLRRRAKSVSGHSLEMDITLISVADSCIARRRQLRVT
mmetsp:Transcript_24548/g.56607  ORF Transcript_24548/g.56607 Transcript_24548/m.56607 type:complete len:120 (+) Transcript_24548:95-454(+)